VSPHYAVKANNDPQLLRWLQAAGAQFDCASPPEMRQVLRVGAKPTDIIYAQPCKTVADARTAQRLGVQNTVVDSVEEVLKLAEAGWRGGTLVRLLVPDAGSAQPFSRKFGAPLSWVPDILYALKHSGQRHVGWSFHVGSGCHTPAQFRQAIELAATADAQAVKPAELMDIGGGFLPEAAAFVPAAEAIRDAQRLFPETTRWIGEPGRFLCAPTVTAEVAVIGKKRMTDGQPGYRYTLGAGIYGIFSSIPFDGFKPQFDLIAPDSHTRPRATAALYGPTCDSADCLGTGLELPELHVGDWLRVQDMGAYTHVSATRFNGMSIGKRIYEEARLA
jgi:ornithine decarboxylase